jgi:autotransporter adhesin
MAPRSPKECSSKGISARCNARRIEHATQPGNFAVNTIYRIVWNAATGKWNVASELATSRTRMSRSRLQLRSLAGALLMAGATLGTGVAMAANTPSSTATAVSVSADNAACTTDTSDASSCEQATTHSAPMSTHGAPLAANISAEGDSPYFSANGLGDGSDNAVASGINAVAVGANAQATGDSSMAIGANAVSNGHYSIAIGTSSNNNGYDNAVAIGNAASSVGADAVAMGSGAVASGYGSLALGGGAVAKPVSSVVGITLYSATALGYEAQATNNKTVAVGYGAQATGSQAIASGYNAVASGTSSMALGANTVGANLAIALGDSAKAQGTNSVAIGVKASVAATATSGVAIGYNSVEDRGSAVSVGSASSQRQIEYVAAGTQETDAVNLSQVTPVVNSLGGGAKVNENGSITAPTYAVQGKTVHTVGDALSGLDTATTHNTNDITNLNTQVTNNTGNITAINNQLSDLADGAVGLVQQDATTGDITVGADKGGTSVNLTGTDGARKLTGVAAGDVSADSTDAVNGSQLNTTNQNVTANTNTITALDGRVTTNENNISHLDSRVTTNEGNITQLQSAVADGAMGLVQQDANTGNITVASGKGGTQMDISGSAGARVLSGVANGTDDSDAVTIAQLKAVGLIDRDGHALGALVYDDTSLSTATLGGNGGTLITNLKGGAIASGSMEAVNGGQLYAMQQNFQGQYDILNNQYTSLNNQFQDLSGKVDGIAAGGGGGGTAPTDPAMPGSGDGSTQVGDGAVASGDNSTATGSNASATGDGSTAMGGNAVASGDNSTATGGNSVASGDSSTAIGAGSKASGNGSTAIGANASASGENSMASGANASATGSNSVALGNGSVADRDNSVSVGSAGNERQITNVAAGTAPTDAVNVSQLQQSQDWSKNYTDQQVNAVNKRVTQVGRVADAGVAGAMAMANIPQPFQAGQSGIGAGVASFRGQSALAVGVSTITPGGRWVVRGSLMTNTQGDAGVGVGALMVW